MRVLIAAVGSRGDVAPLTGLGTALRSAGHDVSVASYGMFKALIAGCGLGFRLVPGDPRLLGASEQGQRWQEGGGGPMSGVRFIRLIAEQLRDVNAALLQAARENTDVVVLAGLAWFGGYRIAEGLGLPSIGLALPDWREGIEVAGYWWPEHPADWTPPEDLERFLAAGPPPVFVGFGSRNPADAARLTEIVAAARRQAGVRMVIQAGWASLGAGLQDGRGHHGRRTAGRGPDGGRADDHRPAVLGQPGHRPRSRASGCSVQVADSRLAHDRDQRRRRPRLLPQPGAGNSEAAGHRRRRSPCHQGPGAPDRMTTAWKAAQRREHHSMWTG
jgi:hypothetical protein